MTKKIKKKKATLTSPSNIKAAVTEIPEVDEARLYSVGFRYFDDKLCILKSADAKTSRKVHEIYRNIGSCSTIRSVRELPHDIKPIHNSDHYAKYFKRVTDDTEVHEFDAGKCRGFFFFDEVNKIVQIIAIDKHPEDKKSKR